MATKKKKKKGDGDKPSHRDCRFVGGPRDGETLRLAYVPMEWVRLMYPTWCTYQWDGQDYVYRGVDPPPGPEAQEGGTREPWVAGLEPGEVSAAQQYIGTDAYRRGVEAADGTTTA